MNNFLNTLYDFIVAIFLTIIGYLLPLKNMAHLVLFFFFLDVIYGYLADRKQNGARFKTAIVWAKTVPRIILSIVLLIMAFMLDEVCSQEYIQTYKVVGWFICSLLFLSILKNGYIVTQWAAIPLIGKLIEKRIEKQTDTEIEETAI
jgi:phage-related holin